MSPIQEPTDGKGSTRRCFLLFGPQFQQTRRVYLHADRNVQRLLHSMV